MTTFSLGLAKRCQLLGFFSSKSLGTLVELGLSLETHDTTTPLSDRVAVELLLCQVLQQLKLSFVCLINASQADSSSRLHVHKSSETSLVLDNHVRNLHLTAEGGQPQNEFNGVNVIGNEHKLSLLLFNQSRHMLQTILDLVRSLGWSGTSCLLLDALLLSGRCLWAILVEKSEDCHGLVLVDRMSELSHRRWNLEALVKHGALTLDAHVLGPFDKAGEITASRADISTNLESAGLRRKERIGLLGWSLGGLDLLLGAFLWCLEKQRNGVT